MTLGVEHGVHAFAWRDPQPGAHVARAVLSYLHHQAQQGTSCPLTMSYAAYPVLAKADAIDPQWLRKASAAHYDPRNRPMAEKSGVTFRSEEHTSELQSLMRISYAVFCLTKH